MASEAAVTIAKMLENLPDQFAEQVVEHVREYIADLKDEVLWNSTFSQSQDKLATAAKKVRKEIQEGKSAPLDVETL
ncbi:hypothetical protein VU08_04210 [Desulfobulbus sp. F5]|nr:hypothetical protein [Desulfobulbus sp. F5]